MKNQDLREIYKEYLRPIDPEQPFARILAQLRRPPSPPSPPSKLRQTCFSSKVKFPRGAELFRKLEQRLGKVCKWDVYKVPTVPLRCSCETVFQHIDPNRKKAGRKTGTDENPYMLYIHIYACRNVKK
ncbi:uncharacterized protein LOC117792709 [Drosophila innubila]|uniref:uncharacterized protein LOC117792709 n=1 Tax=Drosophila innubila TaxID=198719 RepID=UPI00148C34A3|nr:uncharacterized protein LOC117792709 [Drosophila innubila]